MVTFKSKEVPFQAVLKLGEMENYGLRPTLQEQRAKARSCLSAWAQYRCVWDYVQFQVPIISLGGKGWGKLKLYTVLGVKAWDGKSQESTGSLKKKRLQGWLGSSHHQTQGNRSLPAHLSSRYGMALGTYHSSCDCFISFVPTKISDFPFIQTTHCLRPPAIFVISFKSVTFCKADSCTEQGKELEGGRGIQVTAKFGSAPESRDGIRMCGKSPQCHNHFSH